MNLDLAQVTPELPEGFRWRVVRSKNRYVSCGYIDDLHLEKKVLGLFWYAVASGQLGVYSIESVSDRVFKDYFKTDDPNTKFLGVSR